MGGGREGGRVTGVTETYSLFSEERRENIRI